MQSPAVELAEQPESLLTEGQPSGRRGRNRRSGRF